MTHDPTKLADELLPCPFCGVEIGMTLGDHYGHPNIPSDCPARFIAMSPSKSEAIAAWNRRTCPQPTAFAHWRRLTMGGSNHCWMEYFRLLADLERARRARATLENGK